MEQILHRLPTEIVREISEYLDTVYWCKHANTYVTKFSPKDVPLKPKFYGNRPANT